MCVTPNILEPAHVVDDVGERAGEGAAFARAEPDRIGLGVPKRVVGEHDAGGVAPGVAGVFAYARRRRRIAAGRIEQIFLIAADRIQASPSRPARRSAGGLSPPIQIGMCGFCTGFGSNGVSAIWM